MTADEDCKEWSCGVCTYLNKPLFLSCEMCGQSRPSQRPTPPRRQPSLSSDVDGEQPVAGDDDYDIGPVVEDDYYNDRRSGRGSGDRAPRSVQRHISTVNITGTLIMTDDPANYERQDGKKPGEESDDEGDDDSPEQDTPADHQQHHQQQDSMERWGNNSTMSLSNANQCRRPPVRNSSSESESIEFPPPTSRRTSYQAAAPPQHQSHYQHQQQQYHHHQQQAPPPSTRKSYSHSGNNSIQTLPTAYMGSSSRLHHGSSLLEDGSSIGFADDVSSISSGRSSRFLQNGSNHGGGNSVMSGSSRRHLHHHQQQQQYHHPAGVRPRLQVAAPTPQEIHYHGRSSNGLPVITRGGEPAPYHHHQRRRGSYGNNDGGGNNMMMMGDASINSAYSQGSSQYHHNGDGGCGCGCGSSMRSPATPRSTRRPSSTRHLMSSAPSPHSSRNLRQQPSSSSSSVRDLSLSNNNNNQGNNNTGDFLPSLDPPPVPTMDSPGDVDVMAVFARDQEQQQRALMSRQQQQQQRQRMTANETRRDRGKMLDNLSRNGSLVMNSSSSRRMHNTSQRGIGLGASTRLLEEEGDHVEYQEGIAAAHHHHPMMQQDDALDSPNTRKEKNKKENKKRMKGAVRNLMASMRISTK